MVFWPRLGNPFIIIIIIIIIIVVVVVVVVCFTTCMILGLVLIDGFQWIMSDSKYLWTPGLV